MPRGMTDRTILITGCSSGIGLAAARVMRSRGWRVLVTARRDEDLDRLRTDGFEALALELADPASIAACAEAALAKTDGKLFALFNNAAYGQPGAVEDIRADVLRHQFEVNVIGTHDLTQRLHVETQSFRLKELVAQVAGERLLLLLQPLDLLDELAQLLLRRSL